MTKRGPRTQENGPTAIKLQALIAKRPRITQLCAAREIGVSRQRIQQLDKRLGLGMVNPDWLSWPCPRCQGEVRMQRHKARKLVRVNRVYCIACRPHFCANGHEDPRRSHNGNCLPCEKALRNQIVRYRICQDCQKELPVTKGDEQQEKRKGRALARCVSCNMRYQGQQRLSKAGTRA